MSSLNNALRNKNFLFFCTGFISALSCMTLFRLFTAHKPTTSLENTRKRVLFFGDSITQHGFNVDIRGWMSQLGNWWTRRIDILNRGFSGYNSRWGREIFDEVVVKENPDFLFIFFGANDAVDPEVLQHVPLNEYEENLREIVIKTKAVRCM
jgi:lysophospholipase L1-like esterase